MIVIVEYGMGNVGSILNMLKKIGVEAKTSSQPDDIRAATKLILPGVGAFDTGVTHLQQSGLIPILNERVLNANVKTLGICLGMQLLGSSSEEGVLPGLGWIQARTTRFVSTQEAPIKIPHMGWNVVAPRGTSTLFKNMEEDARFYFVHSYHVVCNDEADVAAVTRHGIECTAAVERGNIFGTQFHPEKSHRFGLSVLKNFVELA